MTPEVLKSLIAEGFNRIPIVKQVLADFDTGLGLYHKVAQGPYSFLFESVHGGERWGRYSIIGLPAKEWIKIQGHTVTVENQQSRKTQTVNDPIDYLNNYYQQFKVPKSASKKAGMPRFYGGLVGYVGYDAVGFFEEKLQAQLQKADPLKLPDILLMLSDEMVVLDNLSGTVSIVVYLTVDGTTSVDGRSGSIHDLDAANKRLSELANALLAPQPASASSFSITRPTPVDEANIGFHTSREGYCQQVERIKEYIVAGDVMQVVPSQRMSVPYQHDPLHLYRALRYLNPSPYLFYLNLSGFHIVGSSPEILVRSEFEGEEEASGKKVTLRPIAGTRRRGSTLSEDRALAEELLSDPKEVAEHVMLMDLGRNDVGRIAETGSVKITQDRVVEMYSHVMHIVSNVEGRLKPEFGPFDVLRATFPAGTLSGAPKIRAMEIIAELEEFKRGIYGGAVGYIGFDQSMDLAIAIRTAVIKDGQLHVQAGAGVVTDSQPMSEWMETLNKAQAVLNAMALSVSVDS